MQIQGSGTGNYASTAIVDVSVDAQHGRLWVSAGSGNQPYTIDKATASFTTIEYDHHIIHAGDSFVITGSSAVGNNVEISLGFTTENGSKWAHAIYNVASKDESFIKIWEGATLSGGVILTPINRNRNSATASVNTITSNPVVSGAIGVQTSGTLLEQLYIPATKQAGFETRGTAEFILKSGTDYLFQVTSLAAANVISPKLDWYENTDKIQQF